MITDEIKIKIETETEIEPEIEAENIKKQNNKRQSGKKQRNKKQSCNKSRRHINRNVNGDIGDVGYVGDVDGDVDVCLNCPYYRGKTHRCSFWESCGSNRRQKRQKGERSVFRKARDDELL